MSTVGGSDATRAGPAAGRIVDLSTGIAGAYCTKILADAGYEVLKVEDAAGDPLRRRSVTGSTPPGEDSALFRYLHASKQSLVIEDSPAGLDQVLEIVDDADGVVWSSGSRAADSLDPEMLRRRARAAVVAAITPFGLQGPWANRAWTEFTLQAWSGGPSLRGTAQTPPLAMGGESGLWIAGMFAGVGMLTGLWRAQASGDGDLVDVSILESLMWTHTTYPVTYFRMANGWNREGRNRNLPGIHPARDGLVGFMVASSQQWFDFCAMIEKPDWADDLTLRLAPSRWARSAELSSEIDAWTARRSVDEIIELAALLRVPAAPVAEPASITSIEHFVEREFFIRNPHGFIQPAVPYLIHGAPPRRVDPAPRLGEHTSVLTARARSVAAPNPEAHAPQLPLEGLRILDVTTYWAGPSASSFLAMMGADVIHVESPSRLDGSRQNNTLRDVDDDDWWEWTPSFHGANVGKRDLAIDLGSDEGRTLLRTLVGHCDVFMENFSPRVMDNFGFTYDTLREINPQLIMVRMPAFGISGPWRDFSGYAQTIEMSSGLAWLTGFPDSGPELPNGPCDPIAGAHGVIALLVALEQRRRTGVGSLVEGPMIGGALNIAAEVVIEWSAYGAEVPRFGNRNPFAAPQGLYLTAERPPASDRERWVAISVETDAQWMSLAGAVGLPHLTEDPKLRDFAGRWASHDVIDEHLTQWCAVRSADEIVDLLWGEGVPVAKLMRPYEQAELEQEIDREFFEVVEHPVTGPTTYATYPARFASVPRRLHRRPAPLLGEHNEEILTDLLGLSPDRIAELEASGVIGRHPQIRDNRVRGRTG